MGKSLGLNGPYVLSAEEIDRQVTETSPGNYALGYINKEKNTFVPKYVGRSDSDVHYRLKCHVDKPHTHFKFIYATSAWDAFKRECENFHDFESQLENLDHPDQPNGGSWKCPVCPEEEQV